MISCNKRLDKVRKAMKDWGADLLLLSFGANMTYLTGVQTPMYRDVLKKPGDWASGLLLPRDADPVLILHESVAVMTAESLDQTWRENLHVVSSDENPALFVASIVTNITPSPRTIAVGRAVWSPLTLAVRQAAPDADYIVATSKMMDKIREVKDQDELNLMRKAAEITDAALAATLTNLRAGMTERDVAIEVDYQIRRCGGDGSSFYPGIICVGPGSDPQRHIMTRNTNEVLRPGSTVAFDMGARYAGYCCDFGRSAFVGEPPSEAIRAYASIVKHAQAIVERAGDSRMTLGDMASLVKDRVAADGFGEHYHYPALGHGIGLDVHEDPWIRPGSEERIKKGMCFTVEPKIWKRGEFYVRVEDVMVVGDTCGACLTTFRYDPLLIE